MNKQQQILESIHGIDLSFDARFGVQGSKDVVPNFAGNDFAYAAGPVSLAQELQRLFDLTPVGSFIDDPTYGINLHPFIGKRLNPPVAIALCKTEVLRALKHPHFLSRFRVRSLNVLWNPEVSRALEVRGVLEVYGFSNVAYVQFGPYMIRGYSTL